MLKVDWTQTEIEMVIAALKEQQCGQEMEAAEFEGELAISKSALRKLEAARIELAKQPSQEWLIDGSTEEIANLSNLRTPGRRAPTKSPVLQALRLAADWPYAALKSRYLIEFFFDRAEDLRFAQLGEKLGSMTASALPPDEQLHEQAVLLEANRFDIHDQENPEIVLRYRQQFLNDQNQWVLSKCKRGD